VSIRRLFIFLEQSIQQGIRWAVFEPNEKSLWKKLDLTICAFLRSIKVQGGIQDYYVRIDDALNPFTEQQLGRLHIEIGIQPAFPAEFIIVRIGIWDGGSTVSEG
jgi:phage tail sheath protein FI